MNIIIKKRKNPFVQIDNNIFNDIRISYKAKGLLGYLLSKPENWKPNLKDIYQHTVEGYDSIRSGLEELMLAGYLELRSSINFEDGEFTGRKHYLYEEPLFTEGWRKLENKNKNYTKDEELTLENPSKIKKKHKNKNLQYNK